MGTSPALYSWTSSPAPWTPSALDLLASSSAPTTSFSDKLALVTTGPRATTPKALSSSTPSSMSSVKNPSPAIASRVSRSPTPSVAALALAWAPSSSPRSVRNTPTELWLPTPYARPPRFPTLSSSPTTPPSLSTSSSRTPTNASAWTTRPSTTSASAPSSSPPLPTVTSTTSCPLLCLASPAASASLASSTLTSASSP